MGREMGHVGARMITLEISHVTRYRYRRKVRLNPHRFLLRPRESRSLRVVSHDLSCTPDASVDWSQDVFGNSVAVASFRDPTEELVIDSRLTLAHGEPDWPVFPISASAASFPFNYSEDDRADLGLLATPCSPDPERALATWAKGFVASNPTDTISLLKDMNAGTGLGVRYEARDDYGTQSPLATLGRRAGSCRDIATLFAEAARALGFGARLVSGYLRDDGSGQIGSAGPGSTHAWADVYLPGAGWVAFDPTNQRVGAGHLIPVAVARAIEQIPPVSGGYAGAPADYLAMSVEVGVETLAADQAPLHAASSATKPGQVRR